MQFRSHPALLVGVLAAFRVFVCAQDAGAHHVTPAETPTKVESRRDLHRKAEEAAGKAIVLRQKQTEKNVKAAAILLQESCRLYKASGDYSKAADVEIQTGEIYFILGRYRNALRSYNQALIFARGDPEIRCRALSRMARTYASKGERFQADSYSQEALSLSTGLSSQTQAEALLARGEALQYSDDVASAPQFFTQAHEHFAQVNDEKGQAQALLDLAYLRFRSDRMEALHLTGQALELWSSRKNNEGSARAHLALGVFATVTGDFEAAQCNYQRALPVFHDLGDKDNEAVTLNGLGYVTRERGDLEASLRDYEHAKTIFASVHDQLGAGEALTGIGKALSALDRKRELLPLFREKLRLARQTKNPAQEASALAEMAHVYELEGRHATAQSLYEQALARYRSKELDPGIGDVLIGLAHLRVRQRQYLQAISFLENARLHKDKAGQIEDVARIDYDTADIYLRLKRLQDARAAIEKTIAIIETQRLKIANFDSRASYFASVHRYYSLYIQILMLLHQQSPGQGFLRLAFEASEKSKVRALLDLLSTSSTSSGLSCDELLQKQLAGGDSREAAGSEATHADSAVPVLTLQQIQAELGSDDTVLEYALGDEKSYVWVVDQKGIVAHELPGAAEIRKLVGFVSTALTARQPRRNESGLDEYNKRVRKADVAYQVYGQELSQLLLGPVNLSRTNRILVVPDSSLQYIPFSALPLPNAAKKGAFLVNRHEVVVVPSASALSTLRSAAAKRPPPTSLAAIFANPVFERDDARVRHSPTPARKVTETQPLELKMALRDVSESGHINSLPGSSNEARAIRKALGDRDVLVAEGFKANRDYVLKGGLASYRIIHFATHGIIDPRHPEMSGLILSLVNERGERQDGYLRLGEIYNLKLSADLVVLSACESALGKNLESEGTIGLPRGFLYAGARSVIASLWKVADAATADFMKVFYERIQSGENPSSALRDAQLAMSRSNKWSAPFFWAAFVLQGDYQ